MDNVAELAVFPWMAQSTLSKAMAKGDWLGKTQD